MHESKTNYCLYYGNAMGFCYSQYYCINKTGEGKCKTCGIITLEASLSNLQYRSMEKKMEAVK